MTSDEYIEGRLLTLAWKSVGHISVPAVVTVLFCVRNQVKDGDWMRIISGIEKLVPVKAPDPDVRTPEFRDLLEIVDGVYENERIDRFTNGGLFWCETGEKFWWTEAVKERTGTVAGLELWK